jgi:CDP-glucose 4,6-dehydratase
MSTVNSSLLGHIFSGRVIWLSGHTGFKGAWLAQWLLDLGATVHGFSLAPEGTPSLFEQLGLPGRINHQIGDLRDPAAVRQSILAVQPDFVFHLGAQALVRLSFDQPVATYMTNVGGTIHVLEALRELGKPCAAVLITTDKCFENREWLYGYREEDPVGGYDPYSSSKAAAEIAIASWRRSFFHRHPVRVASARAGNVIGGGDWAKDRILPDCVRALAQSKPIGVRNKTASRPWQHVLEPLSGYLWLAAVLSQPSLRPYDRDLFTSAFNFGPGLDSNRTVSEVVTEVLKHWPGQWEDHSDPNAVHEATRLNLAIDKAHHLLGWKPVWSFEKAIEATVEWYRTATLPHAASSEAPDLIETTKRQIRDYQADADRARTAWAATFIP